MESANVDGPQTPSPLTPQSHIRPANRSDEKAIFRLLESAEYVHLHADWSTFGDWLDGGHSFVLERHGQVRAFITATLDPPPAAWLRALAIDGVSPEFALRQLLKPLLPSLRAASASALICLAARAWLDRALPELHFAPLINIEGWLMPTLDLPDVTLRDGVEIRPMNRRDAAELAAVAALDRAAFPDEPLWWHSERQLERGATQSHGFDVAIVAGRIVGYSYGLRSSRQQGHLVRLTVDPACQGLGIGNQLLHNTLQQFADVGMTQATLNTQNGNAAAHALYQRFGFRPTGMEYTIYKYVL